MRLLLILNMFSQVLVGNRIDEQGFWTETACSSLSTTWIDTCVRSRGAACHSQGMDIDGGGGEYKWCDSLKKCIRTWDTSCPVRMCKDSNPQLCRMMCPHKECGKDECVKRIGSCCDFECVGLGSSDKLNVGDICFQFCEDISKPFINKRYKCPKNTKCLPQAPRGRVVIRSVDGSLDPEESIGFDSCGERAHKCVESN